MLRIAPNPAVQTVTIDRTLSWPGSVLITIYDASGRYVRSLTMKSSRIVWDLTDQHGAQVNAGVYFVEMETETGQVMKKLVLLK